MYNLRICDVSTSKTRPIVPLNWQRRVFDAMHGLSHPSDRTTRRLINTRFVWHGINKDTTAWSKTCLACQSAKMLGTQLHCTTAYHPQSNGLVERFHRQLKASLKARLHGPNWRDELPLVLLGIRAATKEDLGCTSAELVYGKTLRLPGEFFEKTDRTTDPITDAQTLFPRLRETMRNLRAKQTTQHRHHTSRVPATLLTCTFVFVRRDAHRTPLQCPYDGPFRVLACTDKFYTLDIRGKTDMVSIDRLKPAFVDADFDIVSGPTTVVRARHQRTSPAPGLPQATAPAVPLASTQVRRTRSGRQSRPPDRL